jgi:hypothetical protein
MIARRLIVVTLVSLSSLAVGVLFSAPAALALLNTHFSFSFAEPGAKAGQVSSPAGVAVDAVTHDVYVADSGNRRVDEFSSSGTFIRAWGWGVGDGITAALQTCTLTCFAGISGSGAGQFVTPAFVAVDNSAGASKGDVYVGDTGDNLVTKFSSEGSLIASWGDTTPVSNGQLAGKSTPDGSFAPLMGVAVDGSGTLLVLDNTGKKQLAKFAPDGSLSTSFEVVRGTSPYGIAVDSAGDIFKVNGNQSVKEITASNTDIGEVTPNDGATGLAVDLSNGDLYVDVGGAVERYEFAGTGIVSEPGATTCTFAPLSGCPASESFGSGVLSAGSGVAFDSGHVYVADASAEKIDVFVEGVVPDVTTGSQSAHGPGSATVGGTVNPDGIPITSCKVEYGPDTSYGHTAPCAQTPAAIGSGTSPVTVSANLTGIEQFTNHYRLVAANANGSTYGEDRTLTTTVRPSVDDQSVENVASTSATLSARINPGNADTTYSFEYGTDASYGTSLPVPGGDAGSGVTDVAVSAHPQDLTPSTLYHFRVVASNTVGSKDGPDQVFTTQPLGVASGLADGREWEMVSPPQKEGALLGHIEEGIIQASADGNAFTDWSSFEPTEEKAAGAYGFVEANFFGRGADGWTSKTIVPPHSAAGPPPVGNGQEYRMFSEDLSKGILQPFGPATPLVPGVSESTPYLRTDYLNGNPGEQCQSGCFQPLVSSANVPPGTKYGEEGPNGKCETNFCGPYVLGASPDLSHVVLSSEVSLTPGFGGGLYEWSGGELQPVSLLPASEGGGAAGRPSLGDEDNSARHAISDDGSRVVWGIVYNGSSSPLYMRDLARGETVRIDSPNVGAPAALGEGTPSYMTASADVSRIFFLDTVPLTVDSAPGSNLYEYNLAAPAGSRLTDLSVGEKAGEAANASSVVGASEDGSYVYFTAAAGALAPETARGACGVQPCANFLYVHHDGHTTFIAGLSAEDYPDWTGKLEHLTARVSPNGLWLAFMSNRSLTGYDNTDAVSGRPDEEVYLYDASANRLVCASCNPTGARPVGVVYNSEEQIVAADRVFNKSTWIAANVPPWTRFNLGEVRYQSRYLSDSGRLFFDSHDALVAQDVNGTQDVYQYEPAGVGDCGSSLATFSERSGGCVALVSSGESSEESAFLDASETGGDVFFLTSAKLVSQDFDNAYDVYDARECDPRSRCILVAPVGPPPCSTGDGCKLAPSPQPAIFGSPASATFSGAGNVAPAGPAPAVKQRGLTRGQKLARALRACHRKKGKRRAVCERQARARYAVRQSRKANNVTKRGRG